MHQCVSQNMTGNKQSNIVSIISPDWAGRRHAADLRIHPASFHSKVWRGCPSLPSPFCASCRSSHWVFLLWTPLWISTWHVSPMLLQGHRFLNLQIKSRRSLSEHAPNELGPPFWRAPWKGGLPVQTLPHMCVFLSLCGPDHSFFR